LRAFFAANFGTIVSHRVSPHSLTRHLSIYGHIYANICIIRPPESLE